MRINSLIITCTLIIFALSCSTKNNQPIKEEPYVLLFQINDSTKIPITALLTKHNNKLDIRIKNGEEYIDLEQEQKTPDTSLFILPVFGSKIALNTKNINKLRGYYTVPRRGKNYKIDVELIPQNSRFIEKHESIPNANYLIYFGADTTDVGIAKLNNSNKALTATIETETGDYRYLEGIHHNNTIYLSCFDGAHLFYFVAELKNDSIRKGHFYSGNHYHNTFSGTLNKERTLKNPLHLTKKTKPTLIRPELNIPIKNKEITIVQIMGTWCPNCMDESKYYAQELLTQYPNEIGIVALAYEYRGDSATISRRIHKFKNDLNITYPIHYMGLASKSFAAETLPEIDRVISFPTSIFLNNKGEILRIHTGFYGPGTGEKFEEYKKELKAFLQSQLNKKGAQ